jgi:hypothetical protein
MTAAVAGNYLWWQDAGRDRRAGLQSRPPPHGDDLTGAVKRASVSRTGARPTLSAKPVGSSRSHGSETACGGRCLRRLAATDRRAMPCCARVGCNPAAAYVPAHYASLGGACGVARRESDGNERPTPGSGTRTLGLGPRPVAGGQENADDGHQ